MDNFSVAASHLVMHVLPLFRGLAHHPFDSVNVSWTRSVAVDREMVESVCSAAEGIFIENYTLREKTWAVGVAHTISFCQVPKDRADERGKDLCRADVRGMTSASQ